jgi:DnaK suppressor protein
MGRFASDKSPDPGDPLNKQAIRRHLEDEKVRLTQTAGDIGGELRLDEDQRSSLGELSTFDQHSADIASETVERETEGAVLTTLRNRAKEIDAALKRLDAGTYGTCEKCGRPIGEERLEASPTARFCIEHQQEKEA